MNGNVPPRRRPRAVSAAAAVATPGTPPRRAARRAAPAPAAPVAAAVHSAPARDGEVRINRYLAARGVASRRGADLLVMADRVRVNGRVVTAGVVVGPGDLVTVDGRALPAALIIRTLMLNKPVGVVSTRRDPHGRPTVVDLVEDPEGLFPVGRLDTDSRGLLLLTNDGALAMRLTHPRYGITKRYRATVRGRVTPRVVRELVRGVELTDGPARAVDARLVATGRLGDVVEIVMAEGRRREVRRLCAAVGVPVLDLERISIGPLALGRLHEGSARPLRVSEERALYSAAGLPAPGRGPGR